MKWCKNITFSRSDFRAVKVKACEAVPKSRKLLKYTLDDGTGTDRIILSGIHAYYEPEELVGKTLIAIVNLPPRTIVGIDSCGMVISAIHRENGEERMNLLIVDNHIPAGAKLYKSETNIYLKEKCSEFLNSSPFGAPGGAYEDRIKNKRIVTESGNTSLSET